MNISGWILFNVLILGLLFFDLFWIHRKQQIISAKKALLWSAFWISLAFLFNGFIYLKYGYDAALEFTACYLIEKSLSVDNLFVFLMLFSFFRVPEIYQHKVLFFGIIGAIVFRAIFIFAGIELISRFHFLIFFLGIFLIFAGLRMVFHKAKEINPDKNIFISFLKKIIPITSEYHDSSFFVKVKGVLHATPLFAVLIIVETTDIVFAVDSIPAVMAVSKDPFIIYSSNIFAILGLRSLFFALSGIMDLFHYLKVGLALILVFVGGKILLSSWFHINIYLALIIIGGILGVSVVLSILFPKKKLEVLSLEMTKN